MLFPEYIQFISYSNGKFMMCLSSSEIKSKRKFGLLYIGIYQGAGAQSPGADPRVVTAVRKNYLLELESEL